MNSSQRFILSGILIFIFGCTEGNSHRESIRDQNESNIQAQKKDLEPAQGQFEGIMTMAKSHQSFRVVMLVKIIYETVRNPQSVDPTQTMTLPKLSGSLSFPILDHIDVSEYSNYSEIISPMGGYAKMLFDFGDYDTKTHTMILPYNISGYSLGYFGELQGELKDKEFSGIWFAKPLGDVGTFIMRRTDEHKK